MVRFLTPVFGSTLTESWISTCSSFFVRRSRSSSCSFSETSTGFLPDLPSSVSIRSSSACRHLPRLSALLRRAANSGLSSTMASRATTAIWTSLPAQRRRVPSGTPSRPLAAPTRLQSRIDACASICSHTEAEGRREGQTTTSDDDRRQNRRRRLISRRFTQLQSETRYQSRRILVHTVVRFRWGRSCPERDFKNSSGVSIVPKRDYYGDLLYLLLFYSRLQEVFRLSFLTHFSNALKGLYGSKIGCRAALCKRLKGTRLVACTLLPGRAFQNPLSVP